MLGVDEAHGLDHEHRIGGYLHADIGLGVGHLVEHPLVFDGDAVARAPTVHAHSVVTLRSLLPEVVCPLDERGAPLDRVEDMAGLSDSRPIVRQLLDGAGACRQQEDDGHHHRPRRQRHCRVGERLAQLGES